MRLGGIRQEQDNFDLPENRSDGFDDRVLEEAIRDHRNNEFSALAQLNS